MLARQGEGRRDQLEQARHPAPREGR
jgi:hypothetical protein